MNNIHQDNRMNRRRPLLAVVALIVLALCLVPIASAQQISSARTVALGSSALSLAKGVDAARSNPANLGLSQFQLKGFELLGVGANVTNNSFTLSDYNQYTGAFWTDEDKDDILSKVSDEGLQVTAQADANAASVALGSIVFGIGGTGAADINLNKDLLELVLNGNTFADTIEITGSYLEGVAVGSAFLSYGRSIYRSGSRQLSVGATVKYLHGFAVERMVELEGLAATFATGFTGEGRMVVQTATGGWGYALDLGAALQLNENYTAGIRVKNFVSKLKWTKDTEEHGFYFNFDTMTVDNMDDDYVVTEDYTIEIDEFETDLPSVMTVGFAKTSGKLLWALDWEQGFRRAPGASSKPRLAAGVEWSLVAAMPLRVGYSMGGNRNTAFSFGSGFDLSYFFFDWAVVTGASFSGYSSKGLNLAVTTGCYF